MFATTKSLISFLKAGIAGLIICLLSLPTQAETQSLKVCADPNYPPFSSKDYSGFENQIASLIGKELGLNVEYTWFPQRMGFIRNTLKKKNDNGVGYLCDIVMGVPKEFDMAMTTRPYLHSTYALVTLEGGKLDTLSNANALVALPDSQTRDLKIGITERSPGAVWLAKHGLFMQMAPYVAQSGDPNEFPGEPMLHDLLGGKIDAAILWGPSAAFLKRQSTEKQNIRLLPLTSEDKVRFDFFISTAVRHGEKEWRDQIDQILQKNALQITKILSDAGIPLLPNDI